MNWNYLPEGVRFGTTENRELLSTPAGLERAMHNAIVVEGLVTRCDSALCLSVDLGCAQGILPAEDGETIAANEPLTRGVCAQMLAAMIEYLS